MRPKRYCHTPEEARGPNFTPFWDIFPELFFWFWKENPLLFRNPPKKFTEKFQI
jgi:hypothetical protein